MRLLLRILPLLPSICLLAALSTRPDAFLAWFIYWTVAALATVVLLAPVIVLTLKRSTFFGSVSRFRYALLTMAVLLGSIYLSTTYWPLRLRVLLSDPFMRPRVVSLLASPKPLLLDSWRSGLFSFQSVGVAPGEVELSLGSCGIFASCAIAFVSSGPPHQVSGLVSDHLYGPWWHLQYGPD